MNASRPFAPAPRPVAPRLSPVRAGFLSRLPLIALGFLVAAAFFARLTPPRREEKPFAQGVTQSGALQFAEALCSRIAQAPAKAISASAVSTPDTARREPHCEWQVVCHAASDDYFIRLDVIPAGLISLQREVISHPASPGETSRSPEICIDRDAALILSKRYLIASGLAARMERVTPETLNLQDKGRNAWDGYFRCQGEDGVIRRARVGLCALSGRLNRVQRLGVIPVVVMPPE